MGRGPTCRAVLVGFGMAASLGLAAAAAQEPPNPVDPAQPATRVDDVIVTNRPLEEAVEEFVEALSAPARLRGLARWRSEMCIGVVNFRPDAARQIIDQMSGAADSLGVVLGEPGCSPNLVIVGTRNPDALATEMVHRYRREFFRFGSTRSNLGPAALAEFQVTDAPVRWWHVSVPMIAGTDMPAFRASGGTGAKPCLQRESGASYRYCRKITDHITRLLIIADFDQLEGVSYAHLADYLTMVGLAQIDPTSDYSRFETVLNLFGPEEAVTGLTDWDRIYLRALYSAEEALIDPRGQIARMAPDLRTHQEGD